MHFTEIIGLIIAAAAAGAINAVAGGGTLVTFPMLLMFGTQPVIANATSTVALVIGTAGSMVGYRKHLAMVKPWLTRFVPVSLLGGLAGSVLLTHTGNELFGNLVPFLILFATLLFLAQGAMRRFTGFNIHRRNIAEAVVFQFFVAVYGGYFGAGIGILMLASLGFIGLTNIHEMNALKTILGSLINLVAAAWFITAGLVDWQRAGIMTLGALGGYYLGARYAQKVSHSAVRRTIAAIGLVITAATFYRQFIK